MCMIVEFSGHTHLLLNNCIIKNCCLFLLLAPQTIHYFVTNIFTDIESFLATDKNLLLKMPYEFDTEHSFTFKSCVTL